MLYPVPKWAGQMKPSRFALPSFSSVGQRGLWDRPFLPAVLAAGVVTCCWCPLADHALLITIQVRDKGGSLAVRRVLMREEIAYFKGFLSVFLHLDNNRLVAALYPPVESGADHCEELRRNPALLLVRLLAGACQPCQPCQPQGTCVASARPLSACQPCGLETFTKWTWGRKEAIRAKCHRKLTSVFWNMLTAYRFDFLLLHNPAWTAQFYSCMVSWKITEFLGK